MGRIEKAWAGELGVSWWVKLLLTWEEGALSRAEVQHLIDVVDAEIGPLVLCPEVLHYQPIGVSFP